MNLEGTLVEQLPKLEALHAVTTVAGERDAAGRAAERIRARLAELRGRETDVVYRYSIQDPWKRRLFAALCRRYGLSPYTERGRRQSTVLVRAPKTFHHRTLHPESGPPRVVDDTPTLRRVVAGLPGAIAYIPTTQLSEEVRPIRVDGKLPSEPGYPLVYRRKQ